MFVMTKDYNNIIIVKSSSPLFSHKSGSSIKPR